MSMKKFKLNKFKKREFLGTIKIYRVPETGMGRKLPSKKSSLPFYSGKRSLRPIIFSG